MDPRPFRWGSFVKSGWALMCRGISRPASRGLLIPGGGLSLISEPSGGLWAAFVFCSPHPDRASPTVRCEQKTRSFHCGFTDKTCGEGGIRTHGTVLPVRRFSKPFLSATQAPLRTPSFFQGEAKIKINSLLTQNGMHFFMVREVAQNKTPPARRGQNGINWGKFYIAANCTFCCNSITFSRNKLSVSIRSFTVWQEWMTVV
jgi:hypothetical protein